MEDEAAGTAHATDDSQYDEPGVPPESKRYYEGSFMQLWFSVIASGIR